MYIFDGDWKSIVVSDIYLGEARHPLRTVQGYTIFGALGVRLKYDQQTKADREEFSFSEHDYIITIHDIAVDTSLALDISHIL